MSNVNATSLNEFAFDNSYLNNTEMIYFSARHICFGQCNTTLVWRDKVRKKRGFIFNLSVHLVPNYLPPNNLCSSIPDPFQDD